MSNVEYPISKFTIGYWTLNIWAGLPAEPPPPGVPPRAHPHRQRQRFELLRARGGFRKAESFDSIAQRHSEREPARRESNLHVAAQGEPRFLLMAHADHGETEKAREGTHRRCAQIARRDCAYADQVPALVTRRGAESAGGVAQLEAEPGTH